MAGLLLPFKGYHRFPMVQLSGLDGRYTICWFVPWCPEILRHRKQTKN